MLSGQHLSETTWFVILTGLVGDNVAAIWTLLLGDHLPVIWTLLAGDHLLAI